MQRKKFPMRDRYLNSLLIMRVPLSRGKAVVVQLATLRIEQSTTWYVSKVE